MHKHEVVGRLCLSIVWISKTHRNLAIFHDCVGGFEFVFVFVWDYCCNGKARCALIKHAVCKISDFHNQAIWLFEKSLTGNSNRHARWWFYAHTHQPHRSLYSTISEWENGYYARRSEYATAFCIHNIQHCEWKCYFPSDIHIQTDSLRITTIGTHYKQFPFHCICYMIFKALRLYAHYSHRRCLCIWYGLVFHMLTFGSVILSCSVFTWIFLPSVVCMYWRNKRVRTSAFMNVFVDLLLCEETELILYYIFLKISGPSSVSQTNLWMKHTKSSPLQLLFPFHCLCVIRKYILAIVIRVVDELTDQSINNIAADETHKISSSKPFSSVGTANSDSSLVGNVFHKNRSVLNRPFLLCECASLCYAE